MTGDLGTFRRPNNSSQPFPPPSRLVAQVSEQIRAFSCSETVPSLGSSFQKFPSTCACLEPPPPPERVRVAPSLDIAHAQRVTSLPGHRCPATSPLPLHICPTHRVNVGGPFLVHVIRGRDSPPHIHDKQTRDLLIRRRVPPLFFLLFFFVFFCNAARRKFLRPPLAPLSRLFK